MFNRSIFLRDLYVSEVNADLTKPAHSSAGVFTEEDLAGLPEPVQRYFRYCGYPGNKKMTNAEVEWEDVYLKTSPEKKWMKIQCYQYNSVWEPTRIVYMRSNLLGIIPFEGRDKYQDGHGHMLIKMAKLLTVADAKGKEMDTSALVTVLAETLLVPAYALQPYLRWEAMDAHTARATLTFHGITVSGLFHFNEKGEMTCFETHDRYQEKAGSYRKLPWSVRAGKYIEKEGFKFPGELRVMWHLDSGDYEYYRGSIANIRFDIIRCCLSNG